MRAGGLGRAVLDFVQPGFELRNPFGELPELDEDDDDQQQRHREKEQGDDTNNQQLDGTDAWHVDLLIRWDLLQGILLRLLRTHRKVYWSSAWPCRLR